MFGDLGNMMGKLKEAQQKTEEIKRQLDSVYLDAESGGVKVTITGNRKVKDVSIDDELLKDKEELADHLVLALNKAIEKASEMNERELQAVASNMMPNMGGLFNK